MFNAHCQMTIIATSAGTVCTNCIETSRSEDKTSPPAIHGRRTPVRSLIQPKAMLVMLAAIAPEKAA